jgi:hypothetical protein
MRALLMLLLVGCASVQGDGFYRCARSGQCPSSAPVCGTDGLCHASGADAGVPNDAPTSPDAGPSPLVYENCIGMRADMACNAPDVCYYDTVIATSYAGYCSRACTTDTDCPPYDGAPSACVHGRCARGSTGSADCPDTFGSTTGRWEDSRALRLCVDLDIAEANWYNTCAIDGDCERPLSCVNGYCLRACTTQGDCIQDLEVCVASATGAHGCLYQCSGTSECTTLSATCGAGGGCHPRPSW